MAVSPKSRSGKSGETGAGLRANLRQRSLFVARLSQQMRYDVTDILRTATFLSDSELDSAQMAAVQRIADTCKQQLADLTNIADFSKLESGSIALEHEEFDLHAAMRASVAKLAFAANERGVRLCCYVHRDVPRGVVGDNARLRQILGSLLENVVNHNRDSDISVYVALETERPKSYEIRVTMSDSTLGPPDHHDEGLFDFIERALGEAGADAPYTSLGFSIINDLLNLMGGRVGVYGEHERGCAIWFTVELEARDESVERVIYAPHHPILLVSNDPDLIPQVLIALRRCQYVVEFEDDITKMTQRMQQSPYSLVLMDRQKGQHVATFTARPNIGDVRMVPILGVPRNRDNGVDEEELLRLVHQWVTPGRR